jgi:rsbT antagonist protein RsbS
MTVAVLRQGDYLIASIQSELTDSEILSVRDDLVESVGRHRARGIVIDVKALDVVDSFLARSIRSIAVTAKLRGASTVVVGIRPDVAIAMVQFDLDLEPVVAALDLDEAIAVLDSRRTRDRADEG